MTRRQSRLRLERLEDRSQPAVLSVRATLDTQLSALNPTGNYGSALSLAAGSAEQGLLRFDNLFGAGPGQIPVGSTIVSASLTLWADAPATGEGALRLHRMNAAWDAAANWNAFGGNGVQADGGEAVAAADASVPSPAATGYQVVGGLAAAVQAWASGTANRGWVVAADGASAGWAFASADAGSAERRPLLTVQFEPPNPTPNPTYGQLVGQPPSARDAAWFTWQQSLVNARLSRVPSARTSTFYFSQAGNDFTGQGTAERPWRSLAKAQQVLDASSGDVRLRLRGGDTWRENAGFAIARENVTVDSYGQGTAYVNQFARKLSRTWVHAGGDLWKRAEGEAVGWVRQVNDPLGRIYKRESSSTAVAGYALSFFHDAAGTDSRSGGVPTLYLNAGAGIDPNEIRGGFEYAGWTGGWYVNADNVRLENLKVHGAGILPDGTGYGLFVSEQSATFREFVGIGLEFYYTGYHTYGQIGRTGSAVFLNSKGGLNTNRPSPGNPYGGTTTFVSFSETGGQEFVLVDNEVTYGTLPSADWGATPGARHGFSEGVYQHNIAGTPALSVSVRTRYPNNPWQNAFGTSLFGPNSATLEGVRAYVVGEVYDNVGGRLGQGYGDIAWVNCTLAVRPGPSPYPYAGYGHYDSWVINGTFKADMRDWPGYFGFGYGWFGSPDPVNLRLENSRLEAVNLNAEYMTVLYGNAALGPNALVRNSVITFDGSKPALLGPTPDNRWVNNAYRMNNPALPANYFAGAPGSVVLSATPPDAPPSLLSPLYGAGTNNGVGYDRTGAPRPAGRFDIGPLAGAPLPAPSAGALTWGGRTAPVVGGGGVGWAAVRELRFTFAGPVDVYGPSLTLTGTVAGGYAVNGFAYDAATRTATWTLTTPIQRDRLTVFLDGVAAFAFSVLTGDVDGDRTVTAADLQRITAAIGTTNAAEDVDGNGVVNAADHALAQQFLGQTV